MTRVNMLEAKNNLSKLVRQLENHEEDVVYIARNGVVIVILGIHREFKTTSGIRLPDSLARLINHLRPEKRYLHQRIESMGNRNQASAKTGFADDNGSVCR